MSKNILIAYFSHGGENLIEDRIVDLHGKGNTKVVAEALQKSLVEKGAKANLFEIKPLIPYDNSYDATLARSRQEYQDGAVPLINDGPNGFEAYDIVFLGYPNWWGTIPAPILAFIRDHNFAGKTLIPFVTHGGQRFLYSVETIAKEAMNATLKEGFAVAAAYLEAAPSVIEDYIKKNPDLIG